MRDSKTSLNNNHLKTEDHEQQSLQEQKQPSERHRYTLPLCLLRILYLSRLHEQKHVRKKPERKRLPTATRLQLRVFSAKRPSATYGNAVHKNVSGKAQYAITEDLNDYDTFNEHLDEYLEDPEDEITYPPEIYDALIDDEEE